MIKCLASFRLALIPLISLAWACSNLPTQPQVQAPSAPLTSAPTPQPAASPTPTRESMLASHPPGIPALNQVGPPFLYPSLGLTPGKADTLNVADLTRRYTENCPSNKRSCTYSESHRNVPRELHQQVYNEYNVPDSERNSESGEVDHFWPLCAGGSNDVSNLWFQPAENQWKNENLGYHEKDWLEEQICKQIKAGQLYPTEAYKKLTTDWVAYYHEERLRKLG